MRIAGRSCLAVLVLSCPAFASAWDQWEGGSDLNLSNDDTGAKTRNELRHGVLQVGHDLQNNGSPDEDYYIVAPERWHSYEAIVRSGTLYWQRPGSSCGTVTPLCPRFDKVTIGGTVEVAGVPDGAVNNPGYGSAMAVRWRVADPEPVAYLRAIGDTSGVILSPLDLYDIQFRDTTYALPRFNNTGTQITVIIIQNVTERTITQYTTFFTGAGGAPAYVYTSDIPPFGQVVLNTSTTPVAGLSGSVLVANNGPYGALSGKAVALEPSTGFTFDTPMAPIPY